MRWQPKKWVLLAVTVAVAALGSAVGLLRGKKVLRFPYLGQDSTESAYQKLAHEPGWQARSVDVGDGVVLRGLARPPGQPGGPWVVFFNGNSSTMLSEGQRFLSALCEDARWGAAVFAYRGYDGSPGKPNPDALADDAWKIYQSLLKTEKLEPARLHVVGFSLGTSLVAALGAKAHGEPPASLTLLAPMSELDLGKRLDPFLHRYETLKHLGQIKSPTLVVHGAKDQTLPVEQGRLVAERLGSRARYVELAELGHFDMLSSPVVFSTVRAFVTEHSK